MNPKLLIKLEEVFEDAMSGKWKMDSHGNHWYYEEDLQHALIQIIKYYEKEIKSGNT